MNPPTTTPGRADEPPTAPAPRDLREALRQQVLPAARAVSVLVTRLLATAPNDPGCEQFRAARRLDGVVHECGVPRLDNVP